MPIAYFPQNYFAYFLYGSGGSTVPGGDESTNWMMSTLEGIASALAATFQRDDVRIVLDPNDFFGNELIIGTRIGIGVRSIDTIPVSDTGSREFLVVLRTEIRIRLRIWNDALEEVTRASSTVYRTLIANDFGSTAIAPRSRIVDFRSQQVSEAVFELRFGLETQNLID